MTGGGRPRAPQPVLVLGTANPGKVRELRRLLCRPDLDVHSLREVGWAQPLEEPGDSYTANAVAKATAVCAGLGLPALADDSGIEVAALGGWPGPLSARWLGEEASDADRLAGLLGRVAAECPHDRRARYVCALALCRPGKRPVVVGGECRGSIVEAVGEGGFGYDPCFLSSDLGLTFGEAADAAKDEVSHRARAARQLLASGVLGPAAG